MKNEIFCGFCGKYESETEMIVSGQMAEAHICNMCIEHATQYIKEQTVDDKEPEGLDMSKIKKEDIKPEILKNYLDQYVVGQDAAKKAVSVAVYNHWKRLLSIQSPKNSKDEVEIEKSNIFLVGESGVGKTLIVKTMAKKLQVPFATVSVTQMTQAGYVGDDPESALSALLQDAEGNVEKAQMGIVYLDEADKMARKGEGPSLTRDVGGEGVQQALLKIIEGGIVNVPPYGVRKHPDQKMVSMDTTNILFIFGGAFEGINRLIERRLHMRPLGFNLKKIILPKGVQERELGSYVSAQDLQAYGLIRELVGRIPVITYLNPLDKNTLRKVLTEPKNALIKQYKKYLEMEGITLTFTNDALDYIVEQAFELKVGARGLRSICENIMQDAMFDLPSKKDVTSYEINAAYARSKVEKTTMLSLRQA